MNYTVILSPDPDNGGYSVSCPAMPGAASYGEDREAALRNIAEAMGGWYEVAVEEGFGPRAESPDLVASEIRRILGHRAEFGWDMSLETATVALPIAAAA